MTCADDKANLIEELDVFSQRLILRIHESQLGFGFRRQRHDVFPKFLHLLLLNHEVLPVEHLYLRLVFTLFQQRKEIGNLLVDAVFLLLDFRFFLGQLCERADSVVVFGTCRVRRGCDLTVFGAGSIVHLGLVNDLLRESGGSLTSCMIGIRRTWQPEALPCLYLLRSRQN